jgi:hypothetical protein
MKTRTLASAILVALYAFLPLNTAKAESLTVVELFTSQGCSSCPPADEILGELAKEPNILPLSFNVDYWNYIGWKDPFSSPEKTQRQRDYARALGLRHVYTPQVVINGQDEEVGSRRHQVLGKIRQAGEKKRVPVSISGEGDAMTISVATGSLDAAKPADVLLVVFDRKKETDIRRGENAGRKLAYYNVVKSFEKVGQWSGSALSISVSRKQLAANGEGCAVLLQKAGTGEILGAAMMALR